MNTPSSTSTSMGPSSATFIRSSSKPRCVASQEFLRREAKQPVEDFLPDYLICDGIRKGLGMGQNLWCHIWVDEHPFTIYFECSQMGPTVLTHGHLSIFKPLARAVGSFIPGSWRLGLGFSRQQMVQYILAVYRRHCEFTSSNHPKKQLTE